MLIGKNPLNEAPEWFEKNISENIWKLENPFSVKFFELEQKFFTRDFLINLFE